MNELEMGIVGVVRTLPATETCTDERGRGGAQEQSAHLRRWEGVTGECAAALHRPKKLGLGLTDPRVTSLCKEQNIWLTFLPRSDLSRGGGHGLLTESQSRNQ